MKLFSSLAFALSIAVVVGCASNHDLSLSTSRLRTETCKATTEAEIAALFDRWDQSLQTGDPHKVVSNYAERLTPSEKEDYFHHFLENRPSGKIDMRSIELGCNTAIDVGLYTFTYAKTGEVIKGRYTFTYRWNGSKWLISSHHSSVMPENK
jgi:hypothetical protein